MVLINFIYLFAKYFNLNKNLLQVKKLGGYKAVKALLTKSVPDFGAVVTPFYC